MLPSILARQYQEGLIDYIDTSFPITNPIFKGSIRNMLNTKDAVFHEPYVAVRLPFRVTKVIKAYLRRFISHLVRMFISKELLNV